MRYALPRSVDGRRINLPSPCVRDTDNPVNAMDLSVRPMDQTMVSDSEGFAPQPAYALDPRPRFFVADDATDEVTDDADSRL